MLQSQSHVSIFPLVYFNRCHLFTFGLSISLFSMQFLMLYDRYARHTIIVTSGAGKGARGGGCPPPNVEKDGPRNSSKFDEKIEGVGIHLRCEKIINTKYF